MFADFQSSYLEWETQSGSIGKFRVEAVLKTFENTFVLGSEVIACKVYSDENFFHEPVYRFQPLFSQQKQYVLRTFEETGCSNDTEDKSGKTFKRVNCKLNELKGFTELEDINAIEKAHFENRQLQVYLDINNTELQFPVKHYNLHLRNRMFQVETGPVIIKNGMNALVRAFAAFSSLQRIEFMAESIADNERSFRHKSDYKTPIKLISV